MNGEEQGTAGVSFPFPRSVRLLKHSAFDRVYREGRRIFSVNLTVFFRLRGIDELPTGARVGFTVGRVLGGAVDRNRIKRRMREAVRHHLAMLDVPVDVVINPKKTVLQAEFVKLEDEVNRAFQQIGQKSKRAEPATSNRRTGGRQTAKAEES